MSRFFATARELESEGRPFVVITFIRGLGHLPQKPGAKAIVTEKGLHFGTVGGGKVEARAIQEAQALLRNAKDEPVQLSWNLQRDLDMTCGGEMSFLLEPNYPKSWAIAIYGAGHVAQALVRVLEGIESQLFCIDSRAEWREKLPSLSNLRVLDWSNPSERMGELPRNSFHVVITQDHSMDVPVLEGIHKTFPDAPYVGVIGSTAKSARLRKELLELGCNAAFVENIHCPMGLEVGGNKPGEIAVSIAAQLLKVRDERNIHEK